MVMYVEKNGDMWMMNVGGGLRGFWAVGVGYYCTGSPTVLKKCVEMRFFSFWLHVSGIFFANLFYSGLWISIPVILFDKD